MSLSLETIIGRLEAAREARTPLTVHYIAASGKGKGKLACRWFYVASDILVNASGGLYVRTVECEGPGIRAGKILTEERTARDSEGDIIYGADGEPVMVKDDKARTLTVSGRITTVKEGIHKAPPHIS